MESMEEMRRRGRSGDEFEDAAHEVSETGCAGQIRAPGGEVDAGEDNLVEALVAEAFDLVDHDTGGDGAGIATTEGDDAEGAAVVAAVLDLDIGAVAAKAVDKVPGGFGDTHDVVDHHRFGVARGDAGPAFGGHLFAVAEDKADLLHGRETVGFGLGGAARYDHFRTGGFPRQASDFLLAFAHGFGGDRAGVDDDRVGKARRIGQFAHRLAFVGVQAAAKGGDFGGGHYPASGKKTPSKTWAVGPVIQTPSSRQSTLMRPPSRSMAMVRPVNPRRAAATATAQEEEPEASVTPTPLSQTRILRWSGPVHAGELHVGAFGEQGVVFDFRPPGFEVDGLGVVHEEGAMGVAHAGGDGGAIDGQGEGVDVFGQGDRLPNRGSGWPMLTRVRSSPASSHARRPRSVRRVQAALPRFIHQVPGDATGGVAASRRERAIGVVESELGGDLRVGFDDGQLVEAHTAVPVADGARQISRHRYAALAGVDHDEIVAKPVHFHEGQAG